MTISLDHNRSLHVVASLTSIFAVPKSSDVQEATLNSAGQQSETHPVTEYREEKRTNFDKLLSELRPGGAFALTRALAQKRRDLGKGVDLRILSRHAGDWAVIGPYRELFKHYGLTVRDREVFMSNHYVDDETGAPHQNQRIMKFLKRLHNEVQPIDLYLTTNKYVAMMCLELGIPAVMVTPMTDSIADQKYFERWSPENSRKQDIPINVETDLDSTFYDSMSDWFWHLCNVAFRKNPYDAKEIPEKAILLFLEHEIKYLNTPMGKGILFDAIDGLRRLRNIEIEQTGISAPWESSINYSGLTMRANDSLDRAMISALHYGFTGIHTFDRFDGLTQRMGKDVILADEQPQIHFEDAPKHIAAARSVGIPVGVVFRGPYQLESLRLSRERDILLEAQRRLYEMSAKLGYDINKEQVEKYVNELLALNTRPVETAPIPSKVTS